MNPSSVIVATDDVVDLVHLCVDDVPRLRGKNSSPGEMICELGSHRVRVPRGFAATASTYWHFLKSTGLDRLIRNLLKNLNTENVASLQQFDLEIRPAILKSPLPRDWANAIRDAYLQLGPGGGRLAAVAASSSATAEDLPEASFAGQQESEINKPTKT